MRNLKCEMRKWGASARVPLRGDGGGDFWTESKELIELDERRELMGNPGFLAHLARMKEGKVRYTEVPEFLE